MFHFLLLQKNNIVLILLIKLIVSASFLLLRFWKQDSGEQLAYTILFYHCDSW